MKINDRYRGERLVCDKLGECMVCFKCLSGCVCVLLEAY